MSKSNVPMLSETFKAKSSLVSTDAINFRRIIMKRSSNGHTTIIAQNSTGIVRISLISK